ncbi:hypothetical protein Q3G72_018164 [Acer saccharum]|nr:hypothetical protein Q3G72_018164 [Acer saccharum]
MTVCSDDTEVERRGQEVERLEFLAFNSGSLIPIEPISSQPPRLLSLPLSLYSGSIEGLVRLKIRFESGFGGLERQRDGCGLERQRDGSELFDFAMLNLFFVL